MFINYVVFKACQVYNFAYIVDGLNRQASN